MLHHLPLTTTWLVPAEDYAMLSPVIKNRICTNHEPNHLNCVDALLCIEYSRSYSRVVEIADPSTFSDNLDSYRNLLGSDGPFPPSTESSAYGVCVDFHPASIEHANRIDHLRIGTRIYVARRILYDPFINEHEYQFDVEAFFWVAALVSTCRGGHVDGCWMLAWYSMDRRQLSTSKSSYLERQHKSASFRLSIRHEERWRRVGVHSRSDPEMYPRT